METFKSGEVTLYHGDSAHILNEVLAPESVDLTVTSPPYDNMRTYNGHSQFDFERIAQGLYRVTKQGGVVVWVVNDQTRNGCESLTSAKQKIYFVEGCGFLIWDTMIYRKNGAYYKHNHRKYPQAFEYVFVFSKGQLKTFNPLRDKPNTQRGKPIKGTIRNANGTMKSAHNIGLILADFGMRDNVWTYNAGLYNNDDGIELHPATFPEALARDHILSWSNAGDTVLDCFVGSGTTLKMAHRLGRKSIGIEISEEYLPIIRKRVAGAQTPLFVTG